MPPNSLGTIRPNRPSLARASKFLRGKSSFLSDSTALSRSVVRASSISLPCNSFCLSVRTHCGSHSNPRPQKPSSPHFFVWLMFLRLLAPRVRWLPYASVPPLLLGFGRPSVSRSFFQPPRSTSPPPAI